MCAPIASTTRHARRQAKNTSDHLCPAVGATLSLHRRRRLKTHLLGQQRSSLCIHRSCRPYHQALVVPHDLQPQTIFKLPIRWPFASAAHQPKPENTHRHTATATTAPCPARLPTSTRVVAAGRTITGTLSTLVCLCPNCTNWLPLEIGMRFLVGASPIPKKPSLYTSTHPTIRRYIKSCVRNRVHNVHKNSKKIFMI